MASMRHTVVHGVVVITQGTGTPSQDEWDAWLHTLRTRHAEVRAMLIYMVDGGPSGKQRSQLAEVIDTLSRVPPTHIFTSSAVTRGIVTAVSWFLKPEHRARMHPPEALRETMRDLGLSSEAITGVERRIQADLRELALPPAKLASG